MFFEAQFYVISHIKTCICFLKIRHILDNCKEDMEFFNTWIDKGIIDRLSVWALSVTIILLVFIWFICKCLF
jgi:hypothetical protein